MKTILIFMVAIICNSNLYAQNRIDPPKLPRNFNDTNYYNRTYNHFLLGWNWGSGGLKMDKALNMNSTHTQFYMDFTQVPAYTDSTIFPMNQQRIIALLEPNYKTVFDNVVGGRSVSYEPTLIVDSSMYFAARPYDRDGSVFGFKYKSSKGVILDSSLHTNTDYGSYILRKDSVSTPTIVLDSVWKDNILRYNAADSLDGSDTNNGRGWYLSINLKQKDTITALQLTDTILTLTMPYTWVHIDTARHYATNTIQFDSIPGTTVSDITGSFGDYRGKTKRDTVKLLQTRSFIITGAMLKHPSNKIDSSLTLSAHFKCRANKAIDGSFIFNPLLQEEIAEQSYDHITNLGVQVKYHGKVSVAIEWIRIESPQAQWSFRGLKDRAVMRVLDSLTARMQQSNVARTRIHRFYTHEEGSLQNWGLMRYFNMLMDTLAISEVGLEYHANPPSMFYHATGHKEMWNGSSVQFDAANGVPFIRKSRANYTSGAIFPSSFFLRNGYAGMVDTGWYALLEGEIDSLHSSYETFLSGHDDTVPTPGADTLYNEYTYPDSRTNYRYSIQYSIEEKLYKSYFQNYSMLYGKNTWWANQWVNSDNWGFDSTISSFTLKPYPTSRKPLTGEEIRISNGTALLLGAKGLLYWKKVSAAAYEWLGLQPHDTSLRTAPETGKSFLRSIALGGDYIRPGTDANTVFNNYTPGSYDLNVMGIDTTRMYIGLRSIRMEIAKTHTWITQNEDELMKLQLQAWYGKGFVKLYSQHPDFSIGDTILKKYVNTDSIKVRKLFLHRVDTVTANDTIYEHLDSTFYDVMLMRDKDRPMDSVFYIGIDNRRTDPLIYSQDTSLAWSMKFYPTDMLDSLVTSPDSAQFQSLWWRRLGSRKITLPFDYKDSNKRYALLKIKELGAHNGTLENFSLYRRNPELYKTVDTVIGQDRVLNLALLPGEYKILKVEILRPNEVEGILAHSNQTKIVAHAKMSHATGKWVETDTIVHYMTYHKPIVGDTARLGVYFRKSKPATKNMNTAAIQWESEHLLSQNVFHDTVLSICDTCAYPSIVTRFDSVSQEYRSYVVYGCVSDSTIPNFNQQYIVESVVRVKNDTVFTFTRPGVAQFGQTLEVVTSRDLAEWGTPMVNASDTANFYCWADPNPSRAIIVGWKKPDSIPQSLAATNAIGWTNRFWVICPTIKAQHPSLNPYSRYIRGEHENDCALVWQEHNGCNDDLSHIFYTRLYIIDGYIEFGLSPRYIPKVYSPVIFNIDSTIMCVSSGISPLPTDIEHGFPVVSRELFRADSDTLICNFDTYYPGHTPYDVRFDGVYWQSHQEDPGTDYKYGNIMARWIWQRDTVIGASFVPQELQVGEVGVMWTASGKYFDHPVISPGEAMYYPTTENWSGCVNYSDRVLNLDFRSRTETLSIAPPYAATIHDSNAQIIHMIQTHQYPHATYVPVSIVDIGYLSDVHLSERGTVKLNDWQRNDRIYNKKVVIPTTLPTIRTSGQHFFRSSDEQSIARQFYSFGDESLSFGISSVIVGEREYGLNPKPFEPPLEYLKSPDTLSTDWFNVDNIETMDVITTGASPNLATVWLERQSDGQTWDVSLTPGERQQIFTETVELTNGDEEEYRLRICSYDNAPFRRETAICYDEEESYGKASRKEHSHIDLGDSDPTQTVFVYPNPAREEVHMTIKGTERSEVIIVSAIGGEATRFFAGGGKTVTVNTSGFPSGVYVARVRRNGMADAVVPFVVVR